MRQLLITLLFVIVFSPLSAKQVEATVIYVVDGDTLKIMLNGEKTTVRLIGIDTPESKVNDRAYKQAKRSQKDVKEIVKLGLAVKQFVKNSVHKGDTIMLEYDVTERDKYNRHLCYVYLSNGKMLNEEIIAKGYAVPLTIPPNVKNKSLFLKAYRNARKEKLGLWQ